MDLMPTSEPVRILFAISVAASALLIIWTRARRRPSTKLPPGPALDPLIGGFRTMPVEQQWETFARWTKSWGVSPCLFATMSLDDKRMRRGHCIHITLRYSDHRDQLY